MEPLVSLRNVALSVSGFSILEPLTLTISAGESIGVVGPNGSGKSTLLRILATLASPSEGQGTVLGAQLGSPQVLGIRHLIGQVGHLPALTPVLTLLENLSFYARLAGISPDRAEAALEAVGLAGARHRRANDCSAGMKKRADLARLIVSAPQLLLLDEPTDALDRSARTLVGQLVKASVEKGGAAIVVSHDRSNLVGTIERVHSLANGRLL